MNGDGQPRRQLRHQHPAARRSVRRPSWSAVSSTRAPTSAAQAGFEQVRETFITADDWPRFDDPQRGYPWFHDPGSALDEASDDDPPVMLLYERRPANPSRVVQLPCPVSAAAARALRTGCFDLHADLHRIVQE